MDAKITLSFDQGVIEQAKTFAEQNNMSLSRLTEFLYRQIISGQYRSLEELPVSDWVMMVAEGPAEYRLTKRRDLKKDYHERR
jgi:hypothetical protein